MISSLARLGSSRFRSGSLARGPAPAAPTFPRCSAPSPPPRGPSPRRSRLPPHLLRLCSGGGETSRSASGAGAGAKPGSRQKRGPSEAGPVGLRWAWRSRLSPRETVRGGGARGKEGSREWGGGDDGRGSDSEVARRVPEERGGPRMGAAAGDPRRNWWRSRERSSAIPSAPVHLRERRRRPRGGGLRPATAPGAAGCRCGGWNRSVIRYRSFPRARF